MELQLQRLEEELPKYKNKNQKLEKELSTWKARHTHITTQSKEELD